MKLVQNLIVGAGQYLDDLYTRSELIKSGAFKESTLDGYVRKIVSQLSEDVPEVPSQKKKGQNTNDLNLDDLKQRLSYSTENQGQESKSDFSGVKNLKFPLGFFKGIKAYSTYQVFLICWLQNRLEKRESVSILKQRLLRNEPNVLFNDDTSLNHPDVLRFKEVLDKVQDYRANPEKYENKK